MMWSFPGLRGAFALLTLVAYGYALERLERWGVR